MACLKLDTETFRVRRALRLKTRLALNKTTKKGYSYSCARYYDPRTSLWLSVDPLWEQTREVYTYTWNNPVKYVDPTGMGGTDWVEDKEGNIYWKDDVTSKNDKNLDESKGEKWVGKTESVCQDNTCHNFKADGTIEKNVYNPKTNENSSKTLNNGSSSLGKNGQKYISRASNLRKIYNSTMDNIVGPTLEALETGGLLLYSPVLIIQDDLKGGGRSKDLSNNYFIPYVTIKEGKLIINDYKKAGLTKADVTKNLVGAMMLPITIFGEQGVYTTGSTLLDGAANTAIQQGIDEIIDNNFK